MSIIQSITTSFAPIHKEGWRFIAIFAAVTLLFFWLGFQPIAWIGVVLTAWCAYFFRDTVTRGPGDFTRRWPRECH
jgi:phosphatidylserine decarboxylase